MLLKKHLSDLTTTGLKANLQNIPRYDISDHVVRNGQSEQPKIECIYRLVNTKNFTHPREKMNLTLPLTSDRILYQIFFLEEF